MFPLAADCEAKIWKVGSDGEYSPLSCLSGHAQGINDMEWTADSKHVFTAGDDKLLKLWDVETVSCESSSLLVSFFIKLLVLGRGNAWSISRVTPILYFVVPLTSHAATFFPREASTSR
jgi:WD40 repeat protein